MSLSTETAEPVIDMLIGRAREMCVLDARVGAVREHGGTLLIRGEAGVGKSALLTTARSRAERQGVRVLALSAVRSEAQVAFAGLHQMLRPLLDRAHSLPRPQRDALLAAFGMTEASAPDTFLTALATLELLAAEAERTPLLVAVDNAHCLDPPSAEVLGFVARRLDSAPAGLLMALRDGYETRLVDFGLPELRIGPLDQQSAGALLDSHAPRLAPQLRRRVLAAAAGNPLALVELPASVGPHQPVGFRLPVHLPLTARLQQALLGRFAELPRATRALLLVGSVDEEATLDEVLTAAAQLGKDMPATSKDLAPAVALEIIVHDHRRIGFRHPLLPVAIYQAAKPEERHCAHAALAAALLDHPDRRTWHRAASTTGRDEDVAVELERAWVGATTRGTPSIAIAALERAADITVDSSRRDRRLLRAAELAVEIGEADRASRLLGEIDATTFESLDRQRIRLVQDLIEPEVPPNPMAVDWLVDAAKLARSQGEFDVALGLLQAAAMRFWWADPGPDVRRRVVGALQEVPAPRNDPRVLSIRGICDPIGCGGPLSEIVTHTAPDACDPKAALWLGSALHAAGAFDISTTFLTAAVAGLRQQGWLRLLPQGLAQLAWNAIYTGDWNSASAAAEEAAGLARETHQVVWEAVAQTARSMVAAITGDDESAESLLRRAEALVLPLAANAVLADVQLVRAVVALGRGRYEEAFQHLQRTFDPHDPAHHHFRSSWCIGEFVEAAARAGHGHQAREQLARSEGLARRSLSPRLQAGLIYARPLLAENDTAEAEFQSALRADLTRWPLYRARLLLEYGTWLRRRRRIAEARMPLRAAHEAFVALGAVPWGERARQELRASRETGNNKPGAWDQLTEQQLQIAHMAAQGLANREIAQRLYISPAPSVLTCTASSPNSVSPPERRCRRPSRTAGQRLWHREEPTVTDTTQARSTHP